MYRPRHRYKHERYFCNETVLLFGIYSTEAIVIFDGTKPEPEKLVFMTGVEGP
jgi:hypothetical protein